MLEQRLFRLLLWLYPPSFRERYERDMVAAFREAHDERGVPSARVDFSYRRSHGTLPRRYHVHGGHDCSARDVESGRWKGQRGS